MRNIGVRGAPCWDTNVLNVSCTNCYCERVFASSAKLQLALPVRGLERRVRYKTWHRKFISRYPNVCASKEQKTSSTQLLQSLTGAVKYIRSCLETTEVTTK